MTEAIDAGTDMYEGTTEVDISISPQTLSLPRATDGVLECGQFDLEEVSRLSAIFLHKLAVLTVERKSGDPFKPTATMATEVRKDLLEFLNKTSGTYEVESKKELARQVDSEKREDEETITRETFHGMSLSETRREPPDQVILKMLESFLEKKRNFFTSLSNKLINGSKTDEKVEALERELAEQNFWPEERREILAKGMIQRVDTVKMNHCDARFPIDQPNALAEHRALCRFAPTPCPNAGCNRIGSAMHIQQHDSVCLWKLLPCTQSCGLSVCRGKLQEHASTTCRMKPVTCPFAQFGCSLSLKQGQVEEHLGAGMQSHLLMLLQSHLELKMRHEAQGLRLTEAEEVSLWSCFCSSSSHSQVTSFSTDLLAMLKCGFR